MRLGLYFWQSTANSSLGALEPFSPHLEEQFQSFRRWLRPLHQRDTQQELGKPEGETDPKDLKTSLNPKG